MVEFKELEQFQDLYNGKSIFVFSADWCPDCRYLDTFLPELENEFNEYTWVKVDSDEFMNLGKRLAVVGIPSFIVYENGKEIGRFVNRFRKTKEQIQSFINELKHD